MRTSRGLQASVAAVVTLLTAACGPNYRYVYEGEAAFERCYALDFDGNASPDDRTGCWQTWLANYNYGAGADRAAYAHARVLSPAVLPGSEGRPSAPSPGNLGGARGLVADPAVPVAPAPAIPQDAGTATASLLAATVQPPAPVVTPGVSPPAAALRTGPPGAFTMGDRTSAGGNPIAAPPIAQPTAVTATAGPPGHMCATDCTAAWNTCNGQCGHGNAGCAAHCDEAYRDCMRGCY